MIWCTVIRHDMMKYHTYQHVVHNIWLYCIPHGTLCYVIVHEIIWWYIPYVEWYHIIHCQHIVGHLGVSYYIVLYVWSYYIISYHIICFCSPLWCFSRFFYVIWDDVVLQEIVSDPIVLHDITLYHTILYDIIFIVLFYIRLYDTTWY